MITSPFVLFLIDLRKGCHVVATEVRKANLVGLAQATL